MSKSPGGPRDRDQFNRMNRGGPGQGSKPMSGMMGMNYPSRVNQHGGGMMGWQPMMVPPRPPPPKVIELTREEVKLHKADDAWKPGVKHNKGHRDREEEQQKDPEESITDVIQSKYGFIQIDEYLLMIIYYFTLGHCQKNSRNIKQIDTRKLFKTRSKVYGSSIRRQRRAHF
jgi:hypothetical protein